MLIAFAALVLWVAPRAAQNRTFAVYAAGFGGGTILANLQNVGLIATDGPLDLARGLLYLTGGVGVVAFAFAMLAALSIRDRRKLAVAAAIGVVAWIWFIAFFTDVVSDSALPAVGFALLIAGGWFAAFACALVHRDAKQAARGQVRLVGGALCLYSVLYTTVGLVPGFPGVTQTTSVATGLGATILIGLLAALWLWNAAGPDGRAARNVAFLVLGAALLSLVVWTNCSDGTGLCGAPAGTRVLAFALLAYAVVSHQLLGIDVKVRWGISKGTIAGVFVAVFFVASEGAQLLFGDEDKWVGLAAAGALVFAIAPLQRAADRLAERAVPVASPSSSPSPAREDAYRNALRLALRDKRLSREEEVHLHQLAEQLGIRGARAHELLVEVERERAPRKKAQGRSR